MTETPTQQATSQTNGKSNESDAKLTGWLAPVLIFCFLFTFLTVIFELIETEMGKTASRLLAFFSALSIVLALRFKNVENAFGWLMVAYLKFLGYFLLALGPAAFFSMLARRVMEDTPVWAQIVFLVFCLLILVPIIVHLASKNWREDLLARLPTKGMVISVAVCVFLFTLTLALWFFSSVTFLLYQNGLANITPAAGRSVTPAGLPDFFLWHFFDAIPVFEINETIQWKAPFTYEGAGVGWLLLLFKVAVIAPLIAAFKWYWERKEEAHAAEVVAVEAPALPAAPAAPEGVL